MGIPFRSMYSFFCLISSCIGTFRHRCDTDEGSSGAPVLYNVGGCIRCPVLMGVHVRGSAEDVEPYFKVAAVLTTEFRQKMKNLCLVTY